MIIGVPKEIKVREYRVGAIPAGVRALTQQGHTVLVEQNAGVGSGITDQDYVRAGAKIIKSADEVWSRSEMIIKVKEPIAPEYERMQQGQVVYTYFHLTGVDPNLTKVLLKKKVTAIAYETIQTDDGGLPLLKPMSEVAGKMAVQVGATTLEKAHGGKGILLGGVPGVRRAKVAIIGGGVVGTNSAKVAVGMGAEVTILDVNTERLTYLDDIFMGRVAVMMSDSETIAKAVRESDLVVGGVLIPGAAAPKLVSEALIKEMQPGSVVVDVAVDQGGCIETCKPTTHDNPTFVVHDVVHYCVANMPGAVPQTSTFALNNATRPFALRMGKLGVVEALKADPALLKGLNTYNGMVTYEAVARDMGYDYVAPLDALNGGAPSKASGGNGAARPAAGGSKAAAAKKPGKSAARTARG